MFFPEKLNYSQDSSPAAGSSLSAQPAFLPKKIILRIASKFPSSFLYMEDRVKKELISLTHENVKLL